MSIRKINANVSWGVLSRHLAVPLWGNASHYERRNIQSLHYWSCLQRKKWKWTLKLQIQCRKGWGKSARRFFFLRIINMLQWKQQKLRWKGQKSWPSSSSNMIPVLLFSRLTSVTCCEAGRHTPIHKHKAEGGNGRARLDRIKGIFAWRKSNRKNSKFIGSCGGREGLISNRIQSLKTTEKKIFYY